MTQHEYDVLDAFLADCEAEYKAEADKARAKSDADPDNEKKKNDSKGAYWTLFHLKRIKARLRERAQEKIAA